MRIQLISFAQHETTWSNDALNLYLKRFPKQLQVSLIKARGKKSQRDAEEKYLQSQYNQANLVIALDVEGRAYHTQQVAKELSRWMMEFQTVHILVGAAEGLSQEILSKSHLKLSLSNLTLPSHLATVVLIEQLYRAWTLTQNHPYHKN